MVEFMELSCRVYIELPIAGYYPVNMDDFPLLYPFGMDAGDTSYPNLDRDDSYTPRINLDHPIVFFGDTFDHIYVRKLEISFIVQNW